MYSPQSAIAIPASASAISKAAQASYQRRRDAGVLKKGKKPAAHPCLKKTIKPIEQCTREAAALGLTYGQYVARGLDKE